MNWSAHVVFCDDIRQEASGKLLLVGVYLAEMVVINAPLLISIATFIEIRGVEIGAHDFNIRVRFEDGHNVSDLGEFATEMTVIDSELPVCIFPTGLGAHVDRNGHLRVSLSVDRGPFVDIGALKITVKRDA